MSALWASFITGLGVFAIVLQVFFYIGFYVMFCYGLYSIAMRRGEKDAILAWIPLANFYLLGNMIGNFSIVNKEMKNIEILLPIAVLIYYLIGGSIFFGYLIAAVCLLFIVYALYTFYDQVQPERAMFYTIISAILPTVSIPIIFLLIKDK